MDPRPASQYLPQLTRELSPLAVRKVRNRELQSQALYGALGATRDTANAYWTDLEVADAPRDIDLGVRSQAVKLDRLDGPLQGGDRSLQIGGAEGVAVTDD